MTESQTSIEPSLPNFSLSRFVLGDWRVRLSVIICCTLVAYIPVTRCGFIWDDDDYVLENPTLTSLAGLKSIWLDPSATPQYYPLVHSSFWIEYQLWGLDPLGYHLVNVALHLINALLVWRLLVQLNVPGGWLAAVLFAIHPVHVESVAWITERKNVLSGIFYLAAVQAYLTYWQKDLADDRIGSNNRNGTHWKYYCLAGVLYVGALLSKTVTATLPAAIAVIIWWKRGTFRRRDLFALLPFFILGVGSGFITIWLEKHQVGAKGMEWDFSLVERMLIAGRALWFYAGKLGWPYPLIFTYQRWEIDDQAILQYAFPMLAIGVIILLWTMRSRIGRGPLAAILLFVGTLFPALGFFDVYPMRFSFVADHFQYLASIPILTLMAVLVASFASRLPSQACTLAYGAVTFIVIGFMTITWNQVRVYEGLEVLWRDTLRKNPNSWMACNNLGMLLNKRGEFAEAIVHLQNATTLKPDYVEGFTNLGKAYEALRDFDGAEKAYKRSLELDPSYPAANNGMGVLQARKGDLDAASAFVTKALRFQPDYALAYSNLGLIQASQQKIADAIVSYRRAIELEPHLLAARQNLSMTLLQAGKFSEAEDLLRGIFRETPNDLSIVMNLGVSLAQQKRYDEAIVFFEQVVASEPANAKANYNLSSMHQALGHERQAAFYRERFESLQPNK